MRVAPIFAPSLKAILAKQFILWWSKVWVLIQKWIIIFSQFPCQVWRHSGRQKNRWYPLPKLVFLLVSQKLQEFCLCKSSVTFLSRLIFVAAQDWFARAANSNPRITLGRLFSQLSVEPKVVTLQKMYDTGLNGTGVSAEFSTPPPLCLANCKQMCSWCSAHSTL